MCTTARPKGSCLVLLADKNHPAAATACRGQRQPPKARLTRGAAPRKSPPRGVKDKGNPRITTQLAQHTTVPVAEMVRLPESSPDGPLVRPPAAAVQVQGLSTSMLKMWTTTMIPLFSLHAVLGARQRVWSWGTVVQTSLSIIHRSHLPTTR